MEKKWKSSNLLPQFSLKTASLVEFAALSSYYWLNIHCTFMNVIVITYQSQTHTQKKNEAQSCSATVSTSDPRQKQTVSSVYNSLLCMCVFITCTQELLFRGERDTVHPLCTAIYHPNWLISPHLLPSASLPVRFTRKKDYTPTENAEVCGGATGYLQFFLIA